MTTVKADADWAMGLPQAGKLPGGELQDIMAACAETMTFDCDGRSLVAGIGA